MFTLAGQWGPEAILDGNGALLKSMPVYVFNPDTVTSATLYTDPTKQTPQTQPISTNLVGDITFYADPGPYDMAVVIGGVTQPSVRIVVEPYPTDLGVEYVWTFSYPDDLTAGTGKARMYIESDNLTIVSVRASVDTAPTGSDIIVDLLKNGSTVFGVNPGNRPTIADGTNTGLSGTPDDPALYVGDYLTVNVAQVGSTTSGADLTVNIRVQKA